MTNHFISCQPTSSKMMYCIGIVSFLDFPIFCAFCTKIFKRKYSIIISKDLECIIQFYIILIFYHSGNRCDISSGIINAMFILKMFIVIV